MPSPFPGMDPYIEGDMWIPFHNELAIEMARQLTPKLLPRYIARAEKRLVVESPEAAELGGELITPDVGIRQMSTPTKDAGGLATITPPLEMATVYPKKVSQTWIAIRDLSRRKLVTAVEFLSPTNKIGSGRKTYLHKRYRILRSPIHLMEIDLNRWGKRLPMRKKLPPSPYFVFLSRAGRRPITEIWPIALEEPLPIVPVPLLAGDDDVTVDLQKAFTQAYDLSRYDVEFDYSQPPHIPLSPEAETWADQILRAAGRRS